MLFFEKCIDDVKHRVVESALELTLVLSWGRPDVPHGPCGPVVAHQPCILLLLPSLCFFEPHGFYMDPGEKGSLGRCVLFLPSVGFSSF